MILPWLAGCMGEIQALPGDGTLPPDTSEPKRNVLLNQFVDVSQGLPAQALVTSAAALDGALYALVNDAGGKANLYKRESGATAWTVVALPVTGSERPTFITRIDFSLVVTASDGAGRGGLFSISLGDEAFKKLSAPDLAGSQLMKRGGEWLWATAQGLKASTDKGLSWTQRSSAGTALFSQPLRRLVASAAATRLLAVKADGTLFHSDDGGATWGQGLVKGEVTAMVAQGAFVLVETATDGTLRSENYGGTFHPVSMDIKVLSFATLGSSRLLAATYFEMRASENGGVTWATLPVGLPSGGEFSSLAQAGSALLASSDGKVFLAQMEQTTGSSSTTTGH